MISFIYEWLDNKTGLKYVGRHTGTLNDGYAGSGVIFKKEYNNRPNDFVRSIIWQEEYFSDESIKLKEEEILNSIPDEELYNGCNRKYYNQVRNSRGYTSTDNPMRNPATVARMLATREAAGNHKSPYERTIEKYGVEGTRKMNSEAKMGNTFGSGNKNKTKSEDHRRKISESIKKLGETGRMTNGGRKPLMQPQDLVDLVTKYGYKGAAESLNISVVILRYRYYNAVKALKICGNDEIGST